MSMNQKTQDAVATGGCVGGSCLLIGGAVFLAIVVVLFLLGAAFGFISNGFEWITGG